MERIIRIVSGFIIFLMVTLMGVVWQSEKFGLSANLSDVIYKGSNGEIRTTAVNQNTFQISGYTTEEKLDRGFLTLINIILYTMGTISGVMIVVGGFRYIISFGNQEAHEGAKKTILWACAGFLMVILAWTIMLNIIRIGSLDKQLDSSESSTAGKCGPNVTMFCKGVCCGCSSSDSGSKYGCNEGLQCGGPLDVKVFGDEIRVCQKPASPK